jgi:hypothetical protein
MPCILYLALRSNHSGFCVQKRIHRRCANEPVIGEVTPEGVAARTPATTSKETSMPFSTDDLEALRRDLAELPPARPKNVSNRDAVGALTSELAAAQRLGYSVEELAELLSGKGLRMTAGTLKGYLQQARKRKRSQKKRNGFGKAAVRPPIGVGSTTAAAAPAAEPTASSSLPAGAKPAPSGAGDPKPTDPAIGKGTTAAPAPPPPSTRRS